MAAKAQSIFDPAIIVPAIGDSFKKLNPVTLARNPVMFVTEVGALITTVLLVTGHVSNLGFQVQIAIWLWFTVLFANFAEAMAEGRGKAQARALRATRTETYANRLKSDGTVEKMAANLLRKGDVVVVSADELIPGDGEVIEGAATVDESAITGESAPVIRESGGDRSAVTGGTKVLSDIIKIEITSNPGETFLDRMITLVEGASRQKTPNEIALTILLSALTLIFLIAMMSLKAFGLASTPRWTFAVPVLVALLVCLIPTTIGGLFSAIGIAGIDRLVQKNVLAMSGRSVEAAGDVDVLFLDKTGTITIGNRQATDFLPAPGVTKEHWRMLLNSPPWPMKRPRDGRGHPGEELWNSGSGIERDAKVTFVPFTAQTRMSGVEMDGLSYRKGSADAIRAYVGGKMPRGLSRRTSRRFPVPGARLSGRNAGRSPRHDPAQGYRERRPGRAV